MTIGSTSYSKFSSRTHSFYANAAAITSDSAYANARKVMASIPRFVDAIAKVVRPKDPSGYARTLDSLIATYKLTDYDLVPIKVVLDSGASGHRVAALQYLLKAAGYSTRITRKYDSGTRAAVKKFQKAKKLDSDGQAGTRTLSALFSKLSAGTSGARSSALNALLGGLGYGTTSGSGFGSATVSSLKAFQAVAGRSVRGSVDSKTWAALFMALDSTQPRISGTAKVGQTVAIGAGSWGPGSVNLSYQWYRGKTAISGALGTRYAVQAGDAGSKLSVRVSGLRTGYTVTARTSATTATVATASFKTAPTPAISSKAKVGTTLKATVGTWSPSGAERAYQWYRSSTAIKHATSTSYTLTSADRGKKMTVKVTGTLKGYTTISKTSRATATVAAGTLSVSGLKISGTRDVGRTLRVANTWSTSGVTRTYQWYRDSTTIKGATKSTYKLTKASKGHRITVRVTGRKSGYTTLSKKSPVTRHVTMP